MSNCSKLFMYDDSVVVLLYYVWLVNGRNFNKPWCASWKNQCELISVLFFNVSVERCIHF